MLKKLLEGSIGFALLLALGSWSYGGNIWVYDRWWDLTTGLRLGTVDRLVQADKPAEALEALREYLRRDPTDRRLLYRAAGLYLEMGRPLPALAALAAYYDEAAQSDAEKKSPRFESAKALWGVITRDGIDNSISWQVQWQDNIRNPYRVLLHTAALRWNQSVRIYNLAPPGWRKRTEQYSIPGVLGVPVLRTPLTQGLLAPAWARARSICFSPAECSAAYEGAGGGGSLGAAVATGRIAISAPADSSCCAISLDDPDLRPMDDVVAEYFAARNVRSAADIGETAESLNEMLELNSRLAIKHLFVLNYIYNASTSLRNSWR